MNLAATYKFISRTFRSATFTCGRGQGFSLSMSIHSLSLPTQSVGKNYKKKNKKNKHPQLLAFGVETSHKIVSNVP